MAKICVCKKKVSPGPVGANERKQSLKVVLIFILMGFLFIMCTLMLLPNPPLPTDTAPAPVAGSADITPPRVAGSADITPPRVAGPAGTIPPRVAGPAGTIPPRVAGPAASIPPRVAGPAAPIPPRVAGPGSDTADLEALLKTATAQNPGLLAAYSRWQSMLERVPQARALPDPTVNFAWFIREIETRVGPQKGKIGIKQMFPWFGKLKLRAKIASQAADAAKQQYEMLKLELFYKIKKAYAQYYFLGRSMAILRENITLLQFLERVAETKYKAGSTPYATMLRTRVEVDKLNLRLLDTEESLTPVATELNALLNRGFDTPFPVPQDLPATSPDISIAQLKQWVAQNNPALKSLDFMTAKAQTNIKLAKKNLYPDFGLGLEYMFTASVDMGGMMSSGKDPLAAMASLKIPLWFKKNKAAINQANALHRAAVEQKKEVNNNLTVRLEKIVFSFNKAKRKMKLYKESLLLKAEQALNVTRSAFEAGEASFADYIDSQRTLLSFQLEYERAKTEHMQQAARLEMLAGRTL